MFFGPAERLLDPKSFSVTSGQNGNVVLNKVSAFRIIRGEASVGVVRFLAREALTSDTAATGYTLSANNPDSGWIPADKTTHLRIYADGGNVAGQVMTMERA